MKLALPDVTLICIDTVCGGLASMAVDDCVRQCDFGGVIKFFDVPVTSTMEYSRFLWEEAWKPVTTSHFLVVQWDSWIIDPSQWSPHFLKFDYIGAPWWHRDRLNVGNGGFSLRSRKMAEYVSVHSGRYPVQEKEDVALCRHHRPSLERAGFIWADFDLALQFSFECVRKSLDQPHFGFHAFRNWPFVLTKEELDKRLALINDYVKRDEQFAFLMQNARGLEANGRNLGYLQ